ncbi:MAG: FAD-binding oxidoreductase [Hyphomicrobiales bacterium]|nr:FAD-binding oxidoreductase [Hyphomicrobiales bacterium]
MGDRSTPNLSIWDKGDFHFPDSGCLTGVTEVDLAVVGGGIVGLSVALAAATAGVSVAVLEGQRVAAGASGRSSGFVVPALRTLPRGQSLADALGEEKARRFRHLVAGSARGVFDLIDRHGLQVPTARAGWVVAAHTPDAITRLGSDASDNVTVLSVEEIRRLTGIAGWYGGVVYGDGGAVDPAAYARGLAAAATKAGALIREHCPVMALHVNADERVALDWSGGQVRARHVVVATNGMRPPLPDLADAVVPVAIYQMVTVPLPLPIRQAVLGGGHVVTDTRRNSVALRWTPDGRLLTGGLIGPSLGSGVRAAAHFYERRLARFLDPALRETGLTPEILRADQVWSGRIALTGTGLPFVYQAAPATTAIVACNGRGIALGTALGMEVGRFVAAGLGSARGEVDLEALPVPTCTPRARPIRHLAGLGSRLRMPVAQLLDAREVRQAARLQKEKA